MTPMPQVPATAGAVIPTAPMVLIGNMPVVDNGSTRDAATAAASPSLTPGK